MNRLRTRARELRNNATDAERALWHQLRLWQLEGYKFRRQQPLGRFIVDFVCLEKRVVIELDGGQHAERDAWLRAEGFEVLRFWNNEVLKSIEGIKEEILKTLKNTPYLNPPPQGGRRKTGRPLKTVVGVCK